MLRRYTKFVIFSITILIATLLSEWLIKLLSPGNSYKEIGIRMVVTVLIYVPLITFLERYIKKASQRYASESKRLHRSSLLGLTGGYLIALFILFVLFGIVLFDKNALVDILK